MDYAGRVGDIPEAQEGRHVQHSGADQDVLPAADLRKPHHPFRQGNGDKLVEARHHAGSRAAALFRLPEGQHTVHPYDTVGLHPLRMDLRADKPQHARIQQGCQ